MALVSCLECGSPVSEGAEACSFCGRLVDEGPIRAPSRIPPLASITQRLVARTVDVLVVYVIGAIVNQMVFSGVTFGFVFGDESPGAASIVVFAVVWVVYFTLLEAGTARTLGKAAIGLWVTAGDHLTPIGLTEAFVRNLVLVVPLMWLVTLGVMATDGVRRQGFHDKLVGSIVVMG